MSETEQVQVAAWTSISMPFTSLLKIVEQAAKDIPAEHVNSAEVTNSDGVVRIVYWRPKPIPQVER